MTQSQRASVAVLGLGPMGAALAQAFLDADVSTTVWNRSLARADDMVGHGATAASQAQAAIESADLVVVCLRDHTV
ncbi:MAG: NAD(P)-binding domain-containing protein, partial [Nocardioidaceae bacterium]|nr:NAD(P)-binding domain-containing protein [Nocardioidaceae bacterium]